MLTVFTQGLASLIRDTFKNVSAYILTKKDGYTLSFVFVLLRWCWLFHFSLVIQPFYAPCVLLEPHDSLHLSWFLLASISHEPSLSPLSSLFLEDKLFSLCVVVKVFDFTVELYGNVSFTVPIALIFHATYALFTYSLSISIIIPFAGFVESQYSVLVAQSSSPALERFP